MSQETDLIKLYSARILELAADIPHLGRLPAPDATIKRRSPLCGSTVTVDLNVSDGKVSAFGQDVKACALGQAAASVVGGNIVGRTRAEVEAAIAHHGLEANIVLLGWQDNAQVRERLGRARALLLPSFAEGLPVVIMEAMALGRPVISSRIAAIGELVEEGVSGWLTPPSDIDQLVDVMERAATAEPQRLAEMGRRGAQRVAAQHDAMTEAERLAGLMRDCLADDSA